MLSFSKFLKKKHSKAGFIGGVLSGIGGAIFGGIAGSQAQTQRTSGTQGINLGAQSGLAGLLEGAQGLSPEQEARIQALEAEIAQAERQAQENQQKGINPRPFQDKVSKLRNEISQIQAQPKGAGQGGAIKDIFQQIQAFTQAGPGQKDFLAGIEAQRNLAQMFGQASQTGFMPTSQDISMTSGLAQNLFAGQQAQLNNLFQDQATDAQRQSALMGRSAADPILANKLAQSQAREQMVLSGQQTALGTELAMMLPQQRLEAAQMQTNILSGLGNQAMQNRLGLLGLGSDLLGSERQFRLATGEQYQTGKGTQGGGLGGAMSGALAGAGAGLKMFSGFQTPQTTELGKK